jgi:FkbM family methyltransferase
MSALRDIIRALIFRQRRLQKVSVEYCAHNELLPKVLVRTPSNSLRTMLGLPFSEHASQLNQDVFALLYNQFKTGFFVEIGANNGFNLSNTVYLEECFGWSGILIEANPIYLPQLARRRAVVVNKAVASEDGVLEFIDAGLYGGIASSIDPVHAAYTESAKKIKVSATTLNKILHEHKAPKVINFISIDVEGGELPILEQMCSLKEYRFSSGCIEHNFRQKEYEEFKALLSSAGYKVVWEGLTYHDLFFVDGRAGS